MLTESYSGDERPYRPNGRKLTQLFFAGAVSTLGLYLVTYLFARLRTGETNLSVAVGTFFFGMDYATLYSTAFRAANLALVILGVFVIPVAFDFGIDRLVLPQKKWLKGLLAAVVLWLIFEAVVLSTAAESAEPYIRPLTHLFCWLIYGLILEAACRVRFAHQVKWIDKSSAA